jgi:hypothetical protein
VEWCPGVGFIYRTDATKSLCGSPVGRRAKPRRWRGAPAGTAPTASLTGLRPLHSLGGFHNNHYSAHSDTPYARHRSRAPECAKMRFRLTPRSPSVRYKAFSRWTTRGFMHETLSLSTTDYKEESDGPLSQLLGTHSDSRSRPRECS